MGLCRKLRTKLRNSRNFNQTHQVHHHIKPFDTHLLMALSFGGFCSLIDPLWHPLHLCFTAAHPKSLYSEHNSLFLLPIPRAFTPNTIPCSSFRGTTRHPVQYKKAGD